MNAPVIVGQLPVGYCPASYQDLANNIGQVSSVVIPDALSQIVWQATAPSPGTNSAWGKLDSLGRPIGIYFFAQGAWLRAHPSISGTTVWWFNALPDFTVFDGGDGNTVSAISGPMWQLAQDINGNTIQAAFPIAQGTLPSGTVLQLGVNGGEELHTLIPGEDVPHQHFIANTGSGNTTSLISGQTFTNQHGLGVSNTDLDYQLYGDSTVLPTLGATSVTGGVTPPPNTNGATGGVITPVGYTTTYQAKGHQNCPPYVVGYLLQRTGRIFYVG
jgi:hypothetical protein